MVEINYQSDFKLFERSLAGDDATPFRFTYTSFGAQYVASFDGETYVNCRREPTGTLVVIFDNHGLKLGPLAVKREYYLTDADFKDGICNLVSYESAGVVLVAGKTNASSVEVQVPPYYQKGDKGDPFTYDDFTEEQLAKLKGEKGDSFTYDDFTEEQLAKLKGEKGDPLTWGDMTPEQQDALKDEAAEAALANQVVAADIDNITDILN